MPQDNEHFDIIGIGACTIDTFYLVDEFPDVEGVYESSESIVSGGGPVATALAAASAFGSKTAMCDRVGDDWRGDQILSELASFGVDTSSVFRGRNSESSGATALVRRRDGARAITFTRATCTELKPSDLPSNRIGNAKILHLNGRHHQASMSACEIARANGVKISFDGGANRYRESSRDFVQNSDIIIVALDFAKRFSGITDKVDSMAADLFNNSPAELVTITDGIRGSWVFEKSGEQFHQPAIPTNKLVDTTGCGDVYHGAFLHSLSKGCLLREAAKEASYWASKTCEGLGGRSALPKKV